MSGDFDQHVVYAKISRDSAAEILTVRRFVRLTEDQLKPGRVNSPRYVVLGGDPPSYKMFLELWLESCPKSGNSPSLRGEVSSSSTFSGTEPCLHEWLVPFTGFFHAEKQAMYAHCKEMLDGLGLEEIARCAGLSKSQVSNIISHSHARNNRAVLFNLSCAMVFHVTDMLLLKDSLMAQVLSDMHSVASEKRLSADIDGNVCPGPTAMQKFVRPYSTNRNFSTASVRGSLYDATTELVSPYVIKLGNAIKQGVQKHFGNGPNVKHFVNTLLFSCLLPTLGFHVCLVPDIQTSLMRFGLSTTRYYILPTTSNTRSFHCFLGSTEEYSLLSQKKSSTTRNRAGQS